MRARALGERARAPTFCYTARACLSRAPSARDLSVFPIVVSHVAIGFRRLQEPASSPAPPDLGIPLGVPRGVRAAGRPARARPRWAQPHRAVRGRLAPRARSEGAAAG